jgi:hypothetical protein
VRDSRSADSEPRLEFPKKLDTIFPFDCAERRVFELVLVELKKNNYNQPIPKVSEYAYGCRKIEETNEPCLSLLWRSFANSKRFKSLFTRMYAC